MADSTGNQMAKSKVYHDRKPSFGLDRILSASTLEKTGLLPPFEGDLSDRFELVALVDSNSLEEIFRLTNHIDHPWPGNEEVEVVNGANHRSTSVGDLVQLGTGDWYLCEMVGWKKVDIC